MIISAICLLDAPKSWIMALRYWGLKMKEKWSLLLTKRGVQRQPEPEPQCEKVLLGPVSPVPPARDEASCRMQVTCL